MKKSLLNRKRLSQLIYSLSIMLLFANGALAQTTENFTTPGATTWLCPLGVTSITVQAWGGGGSGGATTNGAGRAGGGGCGGSYVTNTLAVVPGVTYNITVGAGGVSGSTSATTAFGSPGGLSSFSGGSVTALVASGGTGGTGGTSANALGIGGVLGGVYGFTITNPGSITYSAGTTTVNVTGGGGSGATAVVSTANNLIGNVVPTNMGTGYTSVPTVSITTTNTGTGATAVALINPNVNSGGTITLGTSGGNSSISASGAGGAGGNGGAGAAGVTGNAIGSNGTFPGGGGSGGISSGTSSGKGGTGGAGKVAITYTATTSNYYYKGSGDLADTSNWGTNTNGTGTPPPNFTGGLQTFYVRNTTATTTPWVVSGANTRIIVGDASLAGVELKINSGSPITGTIDLPEASSGQNSLVLADTTIPTFGNLHISSLVDFQASIILSTSNTFGKVSVGNNSTLNVTGFEEAKTSLNVASGSTLVINTSGNPYFYLGTGAKVTIAGSIKTSKTAGFVSFSKASPDTSTSPTALQFFDAEVVGVNLILTGSTIYFTKSSSGSGQAINPRLDYTNLTISDSGSNPGVCNKTIASALHVSGILTLNNIQGSSLTGCDFITLEDNASIVMTAGSFDVAPTFGASVNVTYNGVSAVVAGNEMPASSTVLKDLTIDNAAGLTLTADTTLKGTLTLTSGTIATGIKSLIIANTGTPISRTSGHVVGNLKKLTAASASPSFKYEIGDATNYTPVELTFVGNTSATGSITASTAGVDPAVAGSGIVDTKDVNRTWTLTNSGITGFTNYGAAFTYASTDNDLLSIPDNYEIHLNSGSWSNLTKAGVSTDTSAAATGITSFGDFAIGESDGTLGLTSQVASKSNYTMYPNPVSDGELYISSTTNLEKEVLIFNTLGQQMLKAKTVSEEAINVSNLNKGTYFVKITEAGITATKKLIIQ